MLEKELRILDPDPQGIGSGCDLGIYEVSKAASTVIHFLPQGQPTNSATPISLWGQLYSNNHTMYYTIFPESVTDPGSWSSHGIPVGGHSYTLECLRWIFFLALFSAE